MNNPYVLWLDLETTGNTPDDQIIEVGMVLTDQDMFEQAAISFVYRTERSISEIEPHVLEMHYKNGLWTETHKAPDLASNILSEQQILGWLGSNGAIGKGLGPLPLAGSGVSHFDRRYIDQYWPALSKRLTYWAYDVGAVRRFIRMSGVMPMASGGPPKNHRALDDVRMHIAEWQGYTTMFTNIWDAKKQEMKDDTPKDGLRP